MTEPTILERELDFFESWDRLCERLTVSKIAMENHLPIPDDDLEILKVIHKFWYNGEISFTKLEMQDDGSNSVIQGSLFSDKTSEPENLNPDGIEVEQPAV